MKRTRKQLGAAGEAEAEALLIGSGYRLLARNWRCRSGEIDLIAFDGEVLVFVEVRTRGLGRSFGTAAESVDARKQRQVRETAQIYIHRHRYHDRQVRFDVVAVQANDEGAVVETEWIRNAF